MLRPLAVFGLLLPMGQAASAALISGAIPGVTAYAFHQGDSGDPNGSGGVNNVVNGNGLTVGNTSNPTTWIHGTGWPDGWQGQGTFVAGSTGAGGALTPGAWFIADLGAAYSNLDDLYIWNVREVGDRGTKNVDIFYASSPTLAIVTGTPYNFTSGGWTSLRSNYEVPQNLTAEADDAQAVLDLSSIPSARYIGFSINSNYNSPIRVGFAELQFTTAVPEPGTLSLTGLMALALTARRRR